MKNLRITLILSIVVVLLLIPLLAMQFSSAIDWNSLDFIIMGVLLTGTGLICELVLRKVKTIRNRLLLCGFVLVLFFLIWVELAVGIFGTPLAGS